MEAIFETSKSPVGKESFPPNELSEEETCNSTCEVKVSGDLAGGIVETRAPGTLVGAGNLPPDLAELASVYTSPLAFVTKGPEPGSGPGTVETSGLEVNDLHHHDGD